MAKLVDRDGRGRLSSLDLVPEEAQDEIFWAMAQLNERRRTQSDILFELNDRLQAKGVDPISKSAFNRKAVRTAKAAARLAERRALFEGLAPQFTAERIDQGTVVLGELIKTMIAEAVEDDVASIGTKGVLELARAFQHSVAGQAISAEAKRRAVALAQKQVGAAVETVAKQKGISAEVRARMMETLGVIQKGVGA